MKVIFLDIDSLNFIYFHILSKEDNPYDDVL